MNASEPTIPKQPGPPAYQLSIGEAARIQKVDATVGLSEDEVLRRRRIFGINSVPSSSSMPVWLRLLRQFQEPLVVVMFLAGGVTVFLGEWIDSSVIFGVVALNAIVGFLQESKAEQAISALARLVATHTTVRREGLPRRVGAEELVPGDVVLLHPGDKVPADLRLIRANHLQIDESSLTGESVPVPKQTEALKENTTLADQNNLVFAGTLIVAGDAEALVWTTGAQTEAGRIAGLLRKVSELDTPLTRKLSAFSRLLFWLVLVLAVATFLIGVIRGENKVEMFMASVALAVGAIPEGLPVAVTIVLAVGVARMAKRRAIIRKLPVVEALGSTTVICSDKTGTLTENQMTVREVFAGQQCFTVTGIGFAPTGEVHLDNLPIRTPMPPPLIECLRAGVLCNEANLTQDHSGNWKIQGDPTEAALLVVAEKAGLAHAKIQQEAPRLDMIPFDSQNMFRVTLHSAPEGPVLYKVGAAERIIEDCVDTLDSEGRCVSLDKRRAQLAVESMTSRGLRVLGLARRTLSNQNMRLDSDQSRGGFTLLGLEGMIDPPRPEVIQSIDRCQRAGVVVKMITGDHASTALVIAQQIGLAGLTGSNGRAAVVTGRELETVSDAELKEIVGHTAVFARVSPEQKLRLVRALQSRGEVVAMTGDGVNDAPALKQADIGVAMGISGTEVAKNAAHMILLDDNFATIEAAVEEGRGVFANLTKFIVCELPTNGGEGLILLTAILLGLTLPALPVQFLWVNLTTSIFLGLALVFEPNEKDLMNRPPRNPRRPLLTRSLILRTGLVSLLMLAGAFWVFFWETKVHGQTLASARTAVVNLIALVETAYLFNCRSLHHSIFSIGLFSNPWAIAGAVSLFVLQFLFTYAPFMNRLFHTVPIDASTWVRILSVAIATCVIVEFEKWLRYRNHPNS